MQSGLNQVDQTNQDGALVGNRSCSGSRVRSTTVIKVLEVEVLRLAGLLEAGKSTLESRLLEASHESVGLGL